MKVPASRRRRRWLVLLVLSAVGVMIGVLTTVLFVWPLHADSPEQAPWAEAAVVLSGRDEHRLAAGVAFTERHPRAVLVVSHVGSSVEQAGGAATARVCAQPGRLCFEPDPVATTGEARAAASLASDHGWDSLAVVTSTSHVTRSRILLRQCYDGALVMVDAGEPGSRGVAPGRVVREWLALMAALTVDRAC